MAEDLVKELKLWMDSKIWNNPKIFSVEKPWYYYVNAFILADNTPVESLNGNTQLLSISDCEMHLGNWKTTMAKNEFQQVADNLKKTLTVSPELTELVKELDWNGLEWTWEAMVSRIIKKRYDVDVDVDVDNFLIEKFNDAQPDPSWWIK